MAWAGPLALAIMRLMERETRIGGAAREFPSTRWSLIRSTREPHERRRALEELLQLYWKPLYFFVRRRGASVEEAKDTVQGFCVHLIEGDFLANPDPAKGRFRSYLRVAIDNFRRNQYERGAALKRGGGVRTVSLDFEIAERHLGGASGTAEQSFEREWALGVMERSLSQLEEEFRAGRRRGPFEAVVGYFRGVDVPSQEHLAKAHGMTVSQFKSFLHRTRLRFRELVRDEVSQTLEDTEDVDAEIGVLIEALRT